ncbi:ABC transporter permease [Hydrogenoanaerobacterium sp.]|uniref:ABC transporter permease n=1 Tax=Hydrogenoanaerobacterium sp. TaxID=2953763 RepID=UPI00289841F4|nr:ABC transporter permease [Hydrogenoanaerobacterium sp.]
MKEAFAKFKKSPAFTGFVLFMIVLIINICVQGPKSFFTLQNISLLMKTYTPLILVTLAQGLLMIMGIIDISIGIQMSLANVVAIMLPIKLGLPLPLAWFCGLLAVVAISALNGFIVAYLRIPPLLAGFAMIYIIKGLNVLIMPKPQGSVPDYIYKPYASNLLGFIPFGALVVAVAFAFWLYLKRTRLVRHMYAIGGNERNAYATGINSAATKMKVYIICGVFTGAAGLCLTAMSASGNPLMGEDYGLRSISACILGGISLSGGWGTLSCSLFGSGFLALIQNSVYHIFSLLPKLIPGFQVNTYWQNLVSDAIILLGLVATLFTNRAQAAAFKQGIAKQIKGGEKVGK